MPACGLLLRCGSPSSSSAGRERLTYVFVLTSCDRPGTKLLLGRFCARRLAAIPHCGRASGENAAAVALPVAAPFDPWLRGTIIALCVERETSEVRAGGLAVPPPAETFRSLPLTINFQIYPPEPPEELIKPVNLCPTSRVDDLMPWEFAKRTAPKSGPLPPASPLRCFGSQPS